MWNVTSPCLSVAIIWHVFLTYYQTHPTAMDSALSTTSTIFLVVMFNTVYIMEDYHIYVYITLYSIILLHYYNYNIFMIHAYSIQYMVTHIFYFI